MKTERLTAEETVRKRYGIINFNDPPYYPTFYEEIVDLMQSFAAQEVEPIKKQRDELLDALKQLTSSIFSYPPIRKLMNEEVLFKAKAAITNAEEK